MRTFNNLMIMAFGLMAVISFAAGFNNHIHFLISAMSLGMAWLAFADKKSKSDVKAERTGDLHDLRSDSSR